MDSAYSEVLKEEEMMPKGFTSFNDHGFELQPSKRVKKDEDSSEVLSHL